MVSVCLMLVGLLLGGFCKLVLHLLVLWWWFGIGWFGMCGLVLVGLVLGWFGIDWFVIG